MIKNENSLLDILSSLTGNVLHAGSVGFENEIKRKEKEEKELETLRNEEIKEKERELKHLREQRKIEKKLYEKIGIKSSTTKQIEAQQKRILRDLTGLGGEGALYQGEESLGNPIEGLFGKAAKAVKGANKKDFLKSLPSGFMEAGEGLMGLGETFIPGKIGSFSGALKKGIRKTKQDYEDWAQIEDREGLGAKGGRMLGEILTPTPGGKLKVAGKLGKFGKALATGSLWGGIEAGKKDYGSPEEARKASLNSAMFGGGVGGLMHGIGGVASKITGKGRTKKALDKIRKDANLHGEEEIIKAAEHMGPDATIGEIVGSKKAIKKINQDSFVFNKKRMEKIEGQMADSSKKFSETLPKGQKIDLYRSLDKTKSKMKEDSSRLYDLAKEEGVGVEGILPKKQLKQWIHAAKEASKNTRGIPDLKLKGQSSEKYFQDLENLLVTAPEEQKAFKNFVIQNESKLPKAEEFIAFRKKVNSLLEKSSSENKHTLDVLDQSLDNIIKDLDKGGLLRKADKVYATKTAPFKDNSLKEAIEAGKFKEAEKGAPSVSSIFSKQSTNNNKIFENLSTKEREQIIGSIVEESFQKRGKSEPARAIYDAWHSIPDYIKNTGDKKIQKILKGLKTIADKNGQLSGIQQATSNTIGSRPEMRKVSSAIRGNPLALMGLGIDGVKSIGHKAYRSRTGQKNLKYYLNPKLLEESLLKDSGKYSRPLMKSLIYEENK